MNSFKINNFSKKLLRKWFCSKASSKSKSASSSPEHYLSLSAKQAMESKWSSFVSKGSYNANDTLSKKHYVLSMFPYPSGNLHMGHVRVYTISDTIARYHRLNGKNVFQPIGFDAFGLPAENAAMERGIPADEWTYSNINTMRKQLQEIGCSFDWDHEIITCDPNYYKFTQQLFLLLYESGLVYKKESLVNWDPVDCTVLADEQVDPSGRSWRSGAAVEKKLLSQWFIRTTRFAQSLFEGLNDPVLQDWRDIINLQRHWIGECNGSRFDFNVYLDGKLLSPISVWTRFPESVDQAQFVGVSESSALNLKFNLKGNNGVYALNPFTEEKLPLYVTDELEYDKGCDSKLGVPCISKVDCEFAIRRGLPNEGHKDFEENLVNRMKVMELAREAGIGGYKVSSHLKDWLVSRQRYWGTPIPIVNCQNCGAVPVPMDQLPVLLPSSKLDATWLNTSCPKCHGPAHREKDTMDTFVDSSWYFLRYTDPFNSEEMFSRDIADRLMPVDVYVGGKEHAVLHLYYARFIGHFLHSLGLLKHPEPFHQLLVQGMVKGKTLVVKNTKKYVQTSEVESKDGKLLQKSSGLEVVESWEKMSKSKHNGVDPNDVLNDYGIDTTRLLILSDTSPTSHKLWRPDSFQGIFNWQDRVWRLVTDFTQARSASYSVPVDLQKQEEVIWDSKNHYIKRVTFNFSTSYQISVAISLLQSYTNFLKKVPKEVMAHSKEFERCMLNLLVMLGPMTPHFASELWSIVQSAPHRINASEIQWDLPLLQQHWPQLDSSYLVQLNCQVNNAVKAVIKMPFSEFQCLSQEEAMKLALSDPKVIDFIENCDILGSKFSYYPSSHAVINISMDPTQKWTAKQSIEGGN